MLTVKSLLNRRLTTLLTVASIALSVLLLLSFERIRSGTKESFNSTISGVDLIVGARSSPIQLLLYSVFHIGDPTNNVSFSSFQKIANHDEVEWAIPVSLGDSHRGYRVVGTDENFVRHYQFGRNKSLEFANGANFRNLYDVVIGAEVALSLGYQVGEEIILSHGTGITFQDHSDRPFVVKGVLEKTLTPIDRSILVSLPAIEAIHDGWDSGAPASARSADGEYTPTRITAFFVKLKSKINVFNIQRKINENTSEAMTAALPGIVLTTLWKNLGFVERVLSVLMFLVFISSLLSLFLVLLTSLKERRREMAILRSVGARPQFIFSLFLFESLAITLSGIIFGTALTYILAFALGKPLVEKFGLSVDLYSWSLNDFTYLAAILGVSLIVGSIPAIMAYRNSLADGLTIKV